MTTPTTTLLAPDALHAAIQKAVAAAPLVPADKRMVVIAGIASENGHPDANAVIAARYGAHWQFAGDAEYHADHGWTAGGQVVASW